MFIVNWLLLTEYDSLLDVQRKQTAGSSAVLTLCITATFMLASLANTMQNLSYPAALLGTVGSVYFLVKVRITRKVTEIDITFLLTFLLLAVIVFDMHKASLMQERMWPCIAILLDVSLLSATPKASIFILFITSLYLVTEAVNIAFPFGMFDILVSDSEKLNEFSDCFPNLTIHDAATIPCKAPFRGAATIISYFFVLVVDYMFTRKFAQGMREEQKRLEASVSLAETVVTALVNFDLSEAQDRIINAPNTPLTDVLGKMLHNLHQYRPYLPDSLFDNLFDEEGNTLNEVPPPQGPLAAILFTDLKSSTAIWEESPGPMKKALQMHNKIIRCCMGEYEGYEVKTIGDSFMIAFETLEAGCACAFSIQERLAAASWPSDLVLPSLFERNGWDGLVVRIGLHFGEVETEINELSGRTDYFGRTVNKAARLEGACTPGGIALDPAMADTLNIDPTWSRTEASEVLKGINEKPIKIAIWTRDEVSVFISSRVSNSIYDISSSVNSDSGGRNQRPSFPAMDMTHRKCATVSEVRLVMKSGNDLQNRISAALSRTIS